MQIDTQVTRRTLLVAGAGGAGVALVAACGSDGSGGDPSSAGPSSSSPSTPAPSSDPSTSSADSSAPGSSGPAADALATLDDIKVGEAVSVDLPGGKPGVVTRTSPSAAVCFSAICTHMGCTVKPDGKQFACPCHGSTYEAATGKVTGGPAPRPLPKVAVSVVDGKVVPG